MADFVIHDTAGNILQVGSCPDEALPLQPLAPGQALLIGKAEPFDVVDLSGKKGKIVKRGPPIVAQVLPPPDYAMQRARAYPSIQDQLDMLWKAMDDGVLPKVAPFYQRIQAVKAAFPKNQPVGAPAIVYPVEPIN